jgi:uncharacterized membrane protein
VNGDGSVVVGFSATAIVDDSPLYEAFIWDMRGMRKLQDVLADVGVETTGWRLQEATSISADGMVIAGFGVNPQGVTEAFVITLVPEPGTAVILVCGSAWALLRRPARARQVAV